MTEGNAAGMTDTIHALTNRLLAERVGWQAVFANGWDYWYPPGVRLDTDLRFKHPPDYLHSADAALTLALAPGYRYDLRYAPGEPAVCYIRNEVDAVVAGTGAHGDAPADVVCRAWWAFKDAQEAR